VIEPAGYYHAKAKALISLGQALCDRFGGEVPDTLEELVTLPGVGRKTANVVLGEAFGKPGVVVDTHVARLARRFGWTAQVDPEKIERDTPRCCPGKSGPRLPAGSSGMVVVSVTPAGPRAARVGWRGGVRRSARVRPTRRLRSSSSRRKRFRDRCPDGWPLDIPSASRGRGPLLRDALAEPEDYALVRSVHEIPRVGAAVAASGVGGELDQTLRRRDSGLVA
jgi:hypothetical protein